MRAAVSCNKNVTYIPM